MTKHCGIPRFCLIWLGIGTTLLTVGCGKPPSRIEALREQYQLTDEEAARWGRLHVEEAESSAVALWSHIGRGEFDAAMLMIKRFGDPQLEELFSQRISGLWSKMITMPAAEFLKEPQLKILGEGTTVGFETWGELFTGGFQRAVLSDDSITAYFVLKGYWQAVSMPVYAAIAFGDFGTEEPQWRPFAYMVFSLDASEDTRKATGKTQFRRDLDQFLTYLRSRNVESPPVENR
jgi:hypothetical protein